MTAQICPVGTLGLAPARVIAKTIAEQSYYYYLSQLNKTMLTTTALAMVELALDTKFSTHPPHHKFPLKSSIAINKLRPISGRTHVCEGEKTYLA